MADNMLTFNPGNLTDDQLMTIMAVANAAKARMDAVEKGCKAILVDRLEPETYKARLNGDTFASINRTEGGHEGKWVVTDEKAYGAWLARQEGMEDFVQQVPLPTKDAIDPGFLGPLVEKIGGGDVPDGVTWKAPAAPQVRVTFKDKNKALRTLAGNPANVDRLLGDTIDVEPKPEPTAGPEQTPPDLFDDLGL